MAPWDEPPSRNCYASKKELLQMEKEKAANKAVEEMMNLIRELFPALDDEEVFEEQTYEESHQEENTMSCDPFEDLDDALFHDLESEEVSEETLDMTDPLEEKQAKNYALRIKPLVMKRRWRGLSIKRKKNYDKAQHIEAPLSLIPLDEGEVVQPCLPPNVEEAISLDDEEFEGPVEDVHASAPPAHKDENMVIFSHTDGLMKVPFDMVDEPIDTFIQTGRRRWDLSCLKFDRDPIYDIEGSSQAEGVSSSEEWSSYVYDSDVWLPGDDMVTDLFHPFEDDLSQHTQSDLQSSFGTYPFEDADLFYEDFQPLCSDFEEYQDMATSEQSEVHSSKQKYFHLGYFHGDSQGKRQCFSTPETVPYLLPSSPRDHAVFFRSLISSQSSTSSESLCMDEDEPSSTYSSPLQRWIDQSCGYTFRQDDRA
jgi:hypothetical protein